MGFSDDVLTTFVRTQLRAGAWNAISEHGRLTCATYSVACIAIFQVLGQDWALKHIGRTGKECDYFRADKADQQDMLRYMSRATELGELIYNLHKW